MAAVDRNWFGGRPGVRMSDAYATLADGSRAPAGVALTITDAATLAKVTDLTDENGQAVTTVRTQTLGYYTFSVPATVTRVLIDAGAGPFLAVSSTVLEKAAEPVSAQTLTVAGAARAPKVWQQATEPTALDGAVDGDWWVKTG